MWTSDQSACASNGGAVAIHAIISAACVNMEASVYEGHAWAVAADSLTSRFITLLQASSRVWSSEKIGMEHLDLEHVDKIGLWHETSLHGARYAKLSGTTGGMTILGSISCLLDVPHITNSTPRGPLGACVAAKAPDPLSVQLEHRQEWSRIMAISAPRRAAVQQRPWPCKVVGAENACTQMHTQSTPIGTHRKAGAKCLYFRDSVSCTLRHIIQIKKCINSAHLFEVEQPGKQWNSVGHCFLKLPLLSKSFVTPWRNH